MAESNTQTLDNIYSVDDVIECIDVALATTNGRELISSGEVMDLFLDLRSIVTGTANAVGSKAD